MIPCLVLKKIIIKVKRHQPVCWAGKGGIAKKACRFKTPLSEPTQSDFWCGGGKDIFHCDVLWVCIILGNTHRLRNAKNVEQMKHTHTPPTNIVRMVIV